MKYEDLDKRLTDMGLRGLGSGEDQPGDVSSMARVGRHARRLGAYVAAGVALSVLCLAVPGFSDAAIKKDPQSTGARSDNAAASQTISPPPRAPSSNQTTIQATTSADLAGENKHDDAGGPTILGGKTTDWAIVFLTVGLVAARAVNILNT